MEIRDNGTRNPLIFLLKEDLRAWLRQKADEAGYSDRALCAVQTETDESEGLLHGLPTIVLMVSNISNSRE